VRSGSGSSGRRTCNWSGRISFASIPSTGPRSCWRRGSSSPKDGLRRTGSGSPVDGRCRRSLGNVIDLQVLAPPLQCRRGALLLPA
jgi:hypothetical protein